MMTRTQFEALMDADGWSPTQRAQWSSMTPLSDADAFHREMARPDGVIWVSLSVRESVIIRIARWLGLMVSNAAA